MQKVEAQHNQMQNQSAQRQSGNAALESPQSEQIAQLEAMAESSPQAGKLAQLTAMVDASPAMAAQRKAISAIHNSPNVIAQRQQLDSLAGETAQRAAAEEPLQPKVTQRETAPAKPNNTGLPDHLKSGIESLSGMSMDSVRVHYNSSQPAQLNALAYAQGTDIHVAPGQEQHLPHEVWHVVQQAQGRVKPTMQMKGGVPVNDDAGLEREADVMGARADQTGAAVPTKINSTGVECAQPKRMASADSSGGVIQWVTEINYVPGYYKYNNKTHVVGSQMTAYLDTQDEVNGSAPGGGVQADLMEDLKNVGGYKSMKRGHLLNDNIGGLGIAMNLFPITSQANARHKNYVESYVKQAIKDDGKKRSKGRLIYQVSVAPRPEDVDSTKPEASFVCDAAWETGEKIVSNTIESKPVSGGTGSGNVTDTSAVGKIFRTKDLPSGWGQNGAGYDNELHGEVWKRTQIHGADSLVLKGTELGHYGNGTPEIDVVAEECRTIVEDTFEDTSNEYLVWMAEVDDLEENDNISGLLDLWTKMTS